MYSVNPICIYLFLLKLLTVGLIFTAGRKPKPHHISNGSPDLGIKKKSREGKGMSHTFSVICMRSYHNI